MQQPFVLNRDVCRLVGLSKIFLVLHLMLEDELRNWREDLAHGNFTDFLARVMAHQDLGPRAGLMEAEVEKALFVGVVLDEYLDQMAKYRRRLREAVSTLDAPY